MLSNGGEGKRESKGEGGQGPTAREESLYLYISAGSPLPEFLVTPLLMGPVCYGT